MLPEISARYGIRSIPTMIMVHKGREIARTSGAMPTQAIISDEGKGHGWLPRYLTSATAIPVSSRTSRAAA